MAIEVYRGDTLEIPCEVTDAKGSLIDLTNYQIRAELHGQRISIKKATANVTGGSDDEIEITDTGQFRITFTSSDTSQLNPQVSYELEVEITSPDGKKLTIIREEVKVREDIITWETK